MAGKGSGGVLGAIAKIVSLVLVAAMLGAVIWYAIATNGFSDFNRVKFGDRRLRYGRDAERVHGHEPEFYNECADI